VVGAGIALAWIASVVLSPSMNIRNLAALVPPLALAVALAAASLGRVAAAGAVAAWLTAAAVVVASWGVLSFTPTWQQHAGYSQAARALAASSGTLVGVAEVERVGEVGEWDVAIRSATGGPLPVVWGELPPVSGPVTVFTDMLGPAAMHAFAWAEREHGPCQRTDFGGPDFGLVTVLSCSGG
jgi:hypothetical protein